VGHIAAGRSRHDDTAAQGRRHDGNQKKTDDDTLSQRQLTQTDGQRGRHREDNDQGHQDPADIAQTGPELTAA